jgi:TRAP-type C4-dicarboxylate transport system permease large subunit
VGVQVILNATLMEDDPSMEVLAFGDVQTIAPSHGAPDCMLTAGVANMSVSQVTRAAMPWLSVLVLVTYVPAISPPCRI